MTRVFEVQIQSPMSYASVALRDYCWAGYKSWHIKIYRMKWHDPDLSSVTKLSYMKEQKQKVRQTT